MASEDKPRSAGPAASVVGDVYKHVLGRTVTATVSKFGMRAGDPGSAARGGDEGSGPATP